MGVTAEIVEELKAKHGEVTELKACGYAVLVKSPSRAVWRKFKTFAVDPVKRLDCSEALFKDCVVYPEMAEVEAMLAKKPALAEVFGGAICELAGATEDVEKNVC